MDTKTGPEEIVLVYPTQGGDWSLTAATLKQLESLFPQHDVRLECHKALFWLEADDAHLKTPRGMKQFLANWLTRAEPRGKPRQSAQGTPAAVLSIRGGGRI